MKKLIACMAGLAFISACAQEAEEPAPEVEEVAPSASMEDYLGTWTVTYPDGSTGVTTNNADGTYTSELADGTATNGAWVFGEEQSCWTPEGAEEDICYTVSDSDETGTRTLTMDDGNVLTVSPVVEQVEAEAAAEEG